MNGSQQPAAVPATNGARPLMGSSPAGTQGSTPTGPNGEPRPKIYRRRPKADPLRPASRPLKKISRPIVPTPQIKTTQTGLATRNNTQPGLPVPDTTLDEMRAQGAQIVPVTTTKRALMEGLRHHVMRLQQSSQTKQRRGPVNIFDEAQFVRPVRLHRRDARAPPSGAGAPLAEEEETKESIEEEKERERAEIAKEERRRIREQNQAKIAPTTSKKPPAFQRKTETVYRPDDTPEAQKRSKLRYEESIPWHLEDFENKQTWVGNYEGELSESHVLMFMEPDGNQGSKARIVPLEKWYKFTAKGKGRGFTAEEADKMWQNPGKLPKFLEKAEQNNDRRVKEEQLQAKAPGKMRTRIGGRIDDDEAPRRRGGDDDDVPTFKREADADDIDFNMEEDFADDEEGLNGLFEGDEVETKEAQERMKRDQLGAGAFDLRDSTAVDREEQEQREERKKARVLEKQFRKALRKREKNYDYDDDSDSDRYGSSSSESETDSETERQREKERKEEEERKAAEQNGKTADGDKTASGASTKGTNTPSGSQKPGELAKAKKRPGSPNLSEASGNESSRKKHKKKHEDRPDASRKSSLVRMSLDPKAKGAASGSESEMTDTGKKKKLKVKLGKSPGGTPAGSRAGSPDASGSRAGSPLSAGGVSGQRSIQSVTPKEIYEALPKDGISIQHLLGRFKNRVGNNHVFIAMVKAVSDFHKQTGLILPKAALPPQAEIDAAVRRAEGRGGAGKVPARA